MMKIYIPTRARNAKQITARALVAAGIPFTRVVDYEERGVWQAGKQEREASLLVCPQKYDRHIGAVRQYIIDQHNVKKDGAALLMLDDDLRFFRRRDDDPTKFLRASDSDVRTCLNQMTTLMRKYAHGGLCAREGANREVEPLLECKRLLRALCYDVTVLRKEKIRFDSMVVMEDFHVALTLLERGYKSFCYRAYVQDQTQSNAPGGCSTYRTLDRQAAGARALHKAHPYFVKVVEKTTSTAWNGATRTDVQVAWQRAFLSSGKEL